MKNQYRIHKHTVHTCTKEDWKETRQDSRIFNQSSHIRVEGKCTSPQQGWAGRTEGDRGQVGGQGRQVEDRGTGGTGVTGGGTGRQVGRRRVTGDRWGDRGDRWKTGGQGGQE